ncbi:MAG: hypothetical protein HOP07_18020 [Bacteriovoracaceae bacterium]|nr:hypothetical protein [Bacteriovoracaceae bacterium]
MFLAFLVDQIQEISCYTFKKLIEKYEQKSRLWKKLESGFEFLEFSSWDQFYYRMCYNEMPPSSG